MIHSCCQCMCPKLLTFPINFKWLNARLKVPGSDLTLTEMTCVFAIHSIIVQQNESSKSH